MKGYQKTLLVLGLSLAMQQGTAWADQTVTGDISGGDYVRTSDGVNGETFTIQSKAGGDLNISGGTFKTANPQIYTQGVVTVRDDISVCITRPRKIPLPVCIRCILRKVWRKPTKRAIPPSLLPQTILRPFLPRRKCSKLWKPLTV